MIKAIQRPFLCVEIESNPVLFVTPESRIELVKTKKAKRMFTNISWTTYITFVALLLAVWYLIIGLRFYLSDLQILLSGKRKPTPQIAGNEYRSFQHDEAISHETETTATLSKEQTDDLFEKVETLSVKLKDAVSDASEKGYNKEEFSFLLQLTLKEFPELKGSPFQIPINNLITSECEKQGFIHLSAVELEMLWVEV
ncbi:MAG: hypothetical protein V4539_09390 [Bacteroidota bacterium]